MRKKPFKFVGLHEEGHNFILERCRYITKDNRGTYWGTLHKDIKNMIPLLIDLLVISVVLIDVCSRTTVPQIKKKHILIRCQLPWSPVLASLHPSVELSMRAREAFTFPT